MNKLQLFPILLICIFLSSCHSLVDDEFDNYEPIPVMNGLLQADSTFSVQISMSANLSDSTPTYVSDAEVIIESSIDTPDTLIYTEKGWYTSSRIVKAGETYTCIASIPHYSIISAQTTVPLPTAISSMVFTDIVGRGEEGEKISSVEFTISNDTSKKQFWQIQLITEKMRSNYNSETNEWTETFGAEDEYIYMLAEQDTVLLNEANPLTLVSNKLMTTNKYKLKFYINSNYTDFNSNEKSYVLLKSVDESYYQYLKQYYIYFSASEINIGQSSQKYPLYSNVKNGLGMFTSTSITKKELITTSEGE